MTSLTGSAGEDFASILRALGYRMEKRPPLPPAPPKPVVVDAPPEAASPEAVACEGSSADASSAVEATPAEDTPGAAEPVASEPAVAAETSEMIADAA